jgi:hypothetical protein
MPFLIRALLTQVPANAPIAKEIRYPQPMSDIPQIESSNFLEIARYPKQAKEPDGVGNTARRQQAQVLPLLYHLKDGC